MSIKDRRLTLLITLVLVLPGLFLLFSADEVRGEDSDILLYFHSSDLLKTQVPPAGLSGDSVLSGDTIEYTLEYPFARSVEILGQDIGGHDNFILHFETLTIIATEPELSVDVFMDPATGTPAKVAGAQFQEDDLDSTFSALDLNIPFISDGYTFTKGSTLRVRMAFTATGSPIPLTPASFTFGFTSNTGSTHLSMRGEPITDDGVRMEMTNINGNPLEEVIPYGPEESRTMEFHTSAASVFGANDIASITILVISSQGSTLLNVTNVWMGDDILGGEEWAYYNETYMIPEGTPTDTYAVYVTARSRTGYSATFEDSFDVRPGLFLTMDEDELEADAGDVMTFQLDCLNGGDANDRVTFSASSQLGWSVDVPEPVEIEGGEEEAIEFKVYVPLRAQVSDVDEIHFRAESRNAEKTYSLTGTVTVTAAATYGIESIGDTVKALKSGTTAMFQVRVLNLQNFTKTFEMSMEGLPNNWGVSYASEAGELQGSLYIFEVNGSGEEVVDMVIVTSTEGPYGSQEVASYVRARGESEKKYSYFTLKVVDDSRSVVEVVGNELRKTAGRVGTSYPVKYTNVYFSLDLYNPTLIDMDVQITVDEPEGWEVDIDYDEIELGPGAGSQWNLSITPKDGESWNQGSPYRFDVTIETGTEGEFVKKLEVVLPQVSDVRTEKEWSSVNAVVGDEVPLNISFINKGNRDETVNIIIEGSAELEINLTPMSKEIAPGEEFTARGFIKVVDVGEIDRVTFTVKYDTSKGTTNIDYTMFLSEKGSVNELSPVPFLIAAAILVILVVAGFVVYNQFIAPRQQKEEKKPPTSKPAAKVSVTSEPPKQNKATSLRPVSGGADSKVIEEADSALASILGDEAVKKGPVVEKVEVVEATIVE